MSVIKHVLARQLIDCKCRPMVEVDVMTDDGVIGSGSAPTGSSVGMFEAYVLRDGDANEYGGQSVHKAVENVVDVIAPAIIGMDVHDQSAIDNAMIALDGTSDKHKLGGNAIYSTSIAVLRAAARTEGMPVYQYLCKRNVRTVPVPSFNVVNGGKNGGVTQPFNEFLIVPYRADSIYEAVEICIRCFNAIGSDMARVLSREPQIARSFGWAAPYDDPREVLALMQETVDRCGYHDKIAFALDCASSEMYDPVTKTYLWGKERVNAEELIGRTKMLATDFPFVFIEDLLDENDWDHYPLAVSEIPNTIILGDDLIATSIEKLRRALSMHAVDGFILKPNQIGTITEALEAFHFARKNDILAVPSGRAGGVVDDIVMDFAVGLEVPFIKNGAPRSGERINKLNFLMRACDKSPGCDMADITKLVRF